MQSTKMTEQAGRKTDPIGKASGNLEKALETMSRQLLVQIRQGQAPCKDLGELAKVMKQAVEILTCAVKIAAIEKLLKTRA